MGYFNNFLYLVNQDGLIKRFSDSITTTKYGIDFILGYRYVNSSDSLVETVLLSSITDDIVGNSRKISLTQLSKPIGAKNDFVNLFFYFPNADLINKYFTITINYTP